MELDDDAALRIANEAVEQAGGAKHVHASPRHPFALHATEEMDIDGHHVVIRFGEASGPAVVEVEDYVFDVRPDGLIKLFGPS